MNSANFNEQTSFGLNNAEIVNKDSFERLKSKNRRKELFRRIFYFFVALFLCALIGVICVIFFFGLENVMIEGNEKYTYEQIYEKCGFDPNTNLFGIDLDATENAILDAFPYISDVSFKRVLPSTLIITVLEDAPMWYTEIAGDWFILSSDLRVISRYKMPEEIDILSLSLDYIKLPEVDYAYAGEQIRFTKAANYDYVVKFLNELRSLGYYNQIDAIDTSDRYHISLYASEGRYKIMLGDSSSLDTKLRFVEKVIEVSFNESSIASINVEYVSSVIVLEQDELFNYR